eukprot:CAMPEP_0172515908 /NCGR_PEP_ID=MMETSP1066-20121228/271915_1 /TAXON_ID=671091 /ORGANISM="Coscinodiscus wailesii, Strain CCMP2513" /LENGTH=298 /DNA_ID=CAMNT_0013297167 /DNA_START=132 /DNA_END=1025 /DNA_ORIENTATION=+
MQFTPQQLAGAQRYGSKTRVGNWFEDLCLEDAKRTEDDVTHRNERAFEEKIRRCSQPVNAAPSHSDGFLRYGDPLTLLHVPTGGALAFDPADPSPANDCAASVSRVTTPSIRNTFVVTPVNHDAPYVVDDDSSNLVRQGIPILLSIRDGDDNKLFLSSERTTEAAARASPVSHRQIIFLTRDGSSYNARWILHPPAAGKNDGGTRFLNAGVVPLLYGERAVLEHCATKNLLTCDENCHLLTDFGNEFEVCADLRSCTGFGRQGALRDEWSGASTANTRVRVAAPQCLWVLGLAGAIPS